MQILRTPDDRFGGLPGYSFNPHYVDVDAGGTTLRVHYIDEGPATAPVILLLHGEPSWSYLYRHMVPILTASGLRAVAMDLVGFGRSDKPADRTDYTYQAHVDWTHGAIDAIGLRDITLVCQDWGGLIGLHLVAEDPKRFARVVVANTFLPTGDVHPGEAFWPGSATARRRHNSRWGKSSTAAAAQRCPATSSKPTTPHFPTTASKPALGSSRCWCPPRPTIRLLRRTGSLAALADYDRPFLCAFSDSDPITRGADAILAAHVPGARHHRPVTIEGAGHFLQEDKGEILRASSPISLAAPGQHQTPEFAHNGMSLICRVPPPGRL